MVVAYLRLENICDVVIGVIGKGMHDSQKVLVQVVAGKLDLV